MTTPPSLIRNMTAPAWLIDRSTLGFRGVTALLRLVFRGLTAPVWLVGSVTAPPWFTGRLIAPAWFARALPWLDGGVTFHPGLLDD